MTITPPRFAVPPGLEALAATPLARAIAMAVRGADAERAHGTLPFAAAVSDGAGAWDALALLPFVDQLSSFPIAAREGARGAMSTIELALQFAASPAPGDLAAEVVAVNHAGAARLVTGTVTDAHGTVVATSSAWFSVGAPPGGGPAALREDARAVIRAGSFRATIGLEPAGDDGAALRAGMWPAVGWVGLPALHGGAVAAGLGAAALRRVETLGRADLRLAALSVRFLRAARTLGAVATARVDALGRRTARLSATLVVAGEEVATAQALFVAD